MLILTRRPGEVIVINDEIMVQVLGLKGNQVRLGINASEHIPIHRLEIWERIRHEQQAKCVTRNPVT